VVAREDTVLSSRPAVRRPDEPRDLVERAIDPSYQSLSMARCPPDARGSFRQSSPCRAAPSPILTFSQRVSCDMGVVSG
jgi:hypothetical protein